MSRGIKSSKKNRILKKTKAVTGAEGKIPQDKQEDEDATGSEAVESTAADTKATTSSVNGSTEEDQDAQQPPNADEHAEGDDEDAIGVSTASLEDKMAETGMTSRPLLRPPRTLETTLFERLEKLYGPGIKRVLTVQYR